jgi:hypothetical protein
MNKTHLHCRCFVKPSETTPSGAAANTSIVLVGPCVESEMSWLAGNAKCWTLNKLSPKAQQAPIHFVLYVLVQFILCCIGDMLGVFK